MLLVGRYNLGDVMMDILCLHPKCLVLEQPNQAPPDHGSEYVVRYNLAHVMMEMCVYIHTSLVLVHTHPISLGAIIGRYEVTCTYMRTPCYSFRTMLHTLSSIWSSM